MIGSIRRHRRGLSADTLAIFSAAWLALALQPCMAGAVAPDTLDTHHGAHGGDCVHCPVSVETNDCIDCDPLDHALVSKSKDPQPDSKVTLTSIPPAMTAGTVVVQFHDHHSPEATGPPLNLLYCCFLE